MMISAARQTSAEVVVGSRYTRGLTLKGFNDPGRFAVSAVARELARVTLPPARLTSDPLSGFFLIRRSVVDGVRLQPMGYKILLEVLVRGRWSKIADVAYAFHSRNAGVSKATLREGRTFLRHLALLRAAHRVRAGGNVVPEEFLTTTVISRAPSAAGEELFVAYGQRYDPLASAALHEEAGVEG
jgi:hypothetical protein